MKHFTYGLTPAMGAVLYTFGRELKGRREVRIAFDAIAAYAGTRQKTLERAILHLESMELLMIPGPISAQTCSTAPSAPSRTGSGRAGT